MLTVKPALVSTGVEKVGVSAAPKDAFPVTVDDPLA